MFAFGMFEIIFIIAILVMIRSFFRFSSLQGEVFRQFRGHRNEVQEPPASPTQQPNLDGCNNCGAALDANTEISPSGDYKCPFCNSWSNVNR